MSHHKERTEKDCLNCGTIVQGRYCQNCGQENLEPHETVWGLVSHFFNDITHFDGKFFSSVRLLLTKPGYLSQEYIKGRRARYLHPIRMYVFTSAFFFIIFFSVFNPGHLLNGTSAAEQWKVYHEASESLKETMKDNQDSVIKMAQKRALAKIEKAEQQYRRQMDNQGQQDSLWEANPAQATNNLLDSIDKNVTLAQIKDSLGKASGKEPTHRLLDSLGKQIPAAAAKLKKADSTLKEKEKEDEDKDSSEVQIRPGVKAHFNNFQYHSQIAYDSVQAELPDSLKTGWFSRLMAHRAITLNSKFKDNRKEAINLFMERFMHMLPQAMFVSLPLSALILLILYARRKFNYVDHGIFSIHLYCASYIMLLIYFGLDKLKTTTGLGLFNPLKVLMILGIFFYFLLAMKRFYHQRWIKTIIKYLLYNFMAMFFMIILIALFFLISLYQLS